MVKKKKPVEINRNKYNQIRKMDHSTMEECIGGYWPNKRDRPGEIGADSFGNGSSRSKRDGSRRPGCLRT